LKFYLIFRKILAFTALVAAQGLTLVATQSTNIYSHDSRNGRRLKTEASDATSNQLTTIRAQDGSASLSTAGNALFAGVDVSGTRGALIAAQGDLTATSVTDTASHSLREEQKGGFLQKKVGARICI
jgi:hypothetical protein